MSVCVENCNFKTNHSNFSQSLSVSEKAVKLPSYQAKILKKITLWKSRSRQRKALAQLDERMLIDIGYTAEQAQQEINQPFWK